MPPRLIHIPGPPRTLGTGLENRRVVRAERPRCRGSEIFTTDGADAIPLAIKTSVLLPAGVPGGRVNLVEDFMPGRTDTDVHLLVRA